jgi:hypothetical protein
MDFNENMAVLYWRGYRTQIFKTTVEDSSHKHPKHVKLTVKYAFKAHWKKIDDAVSKLELFFPGLQVRASLLI